MRVRVVVVAEAAAFIWVAAEAVARILVAAILVVVALSTVGVHASAVRISEGAAVISAAPVSFMEGDVMSARRAPSPGREAPAMSVVRSTGVPAMLHGQRPGVREWLQL